MNTTPQREHWDGHPVELGDAWILRKGDKVARCLLVTHPLGWELRLTVGELVRSQVCRSGDDVLKTQQSWKTAMVDVEGTFLTRVAVTSSFIEFLID